MVNHKFKLSEFKWFVLITMAFGYLGLFGAIDGRLWPAAAPMSLTKWSEDGQGGTVFYGKSEKLRASCSWRGFDWNLGDSNIAHVAVTIDTKAAVSRPAGPFSFGPWYANVTPLDFMKTHAIVLHRCFVPTPIVLSYDDAGTPEYLKIPYPFLTRSPFWR